MTMTTTATTTTATTRMTVWLNGHAVAIDRTEELCTIYTVALQEAESWRVSNCPDVPGMTREEGLVGYQARLEYCGYKPRYSFTPPKEGDIVLDLVEDEIILARGGVI